MLPTTGDYDELHAQLTKACLASVDLEHLERAEEKLKLMRKQRMHVAAGCGKDELRQQMSWELITAPQGSHTERPCPITDCPCNEPCNPGEVLSITSGAVDQCLGPGADRLLFESLVEAALASEEGSVWPAGGKLIFSAFDRNQSVNALVRTLESANQQRCAQMMLKLVQSSEATYGGFVSAVQVNFHCTGESFHDQHRDVYGAKQRAGPNCACSFKECVGTVCYSLGSSRLWSRGTSLAAQWGRHVLQCQVESESHPWHSQDVQWERPSDFGGFLAGRQLTSAGPFGRR